MEKSQKTNKKLIVSKKDESPKYWMSKGEYTNIIVNANQTNNEYVITHGIISLNQKQWKINRSTGELYISW